MIVPRFEYASGLDLGEQRPCCTLGGGLAKRMVITIVIQGPVVQSPIN